LLSHLLQEIRWVHEIFFRDVGNSRFLPLPVVPPSLIMEGTRKKEIRE